MEIQSKVKAFVFFVCMFAGSTMFAPQCNNCKLDFEIEPTGILPTAALAKLGYENYCQCCWHAMLQHNKQSLRQQFSPESASPQSIVHKLKILNFTAFSDFIVKIQDSIQRKKLQGALIINFVDTKPADEKRPLDQFLSLNKAELKALATLLPYATLHFKYDQNEVVCKLTQNAGKLAISTIVFDANHQVVITFPLNGTKNPAHLADALLQPISPCCSAEQKMALPYDGTPPQVS